MMNPTFTRGRDICPGFVVITFQRLKNSAPLFITKTHYQHQFLDNEDGSNYTYHALAYTTAFG
jgi:hypothetical protein